MNRDLKKKENPRSVTLKVDAKQNIFTLEKNNDKNKTTTVKTCSIMPVCYNLHMKFARNNDDSLKEVLIYKINYESFFLMV